MDGPLELLYSGPSLLCSVAVVGVVRLVTAIIDVRIGVERRKANRILSKVVLPAVTVVLGGLYACLVPFRPDVLTVYVIEHAPNLWGYLAFFSWGGACGQFAQTLYDRVTDLAPKKKRKAEGQP